MSVFVGGLGVRGAIGQAKTQMLRQSKYLTSAFRQELPSIQIKPGVKSIPLDDVFYLSVGMVLNAHEKINKGAFVLDDLISSKVDSTHIAPYVGGRDVGQYGCLSVKYLEYGNGTRVPSQIRRPTFPELYEHPKLMIGRFGGIVYDDGKWSGAGFLKCNHTVMLLMPWHHLAGVENRAIADQLGTRKIYRTRLETTSKSIDPWYVMAYLNSDIAKSILNGVATSAINGEIQPNDLRKVSIPVPEDAGLVKQISDLAQQTSAIQRQLLPIRQQGWQITDKAIAPAVIPTGIAALPLDRARVKWNLLISNSAAKVHKLNRVDHRLFVGKQEVARLPSTAPLEAMEWLRRQWLQYPEGTTVGEMEALNPLVPETPALAVKALAQIEAEELKVAEMLSQIDGARREILALLDSMFERIQHPPIK